MFVFRKKDKDKGFSEGESLKTREEEDRALVPSCQHYNIRL
jgi:hypothetical protein